MDTPAELAALNRRFRIAVMRRKRASNQTSDHYVQTHVALPLGKAHVEDLKGL